MLETGNDFQKPMKFAHFIPLTHVRQISEPVQLFDLKCFPILSFRLKTYNKHLISLEFLVGTVSYGSSFFPLDLWPKHEAVLSGRHAVNYNLLTGAYSNKFEFTKT